MFDMVSLPSVLRPRVCDDLIRIGRGRDGGYIVSKSDVLASDALLSLGVNLDWSMEQDFIALNSVPLHAYDGTIGRQRLWDTMMGYRAVGRRKREKELRALWWKHRSFFWGKRKQFQAFVGETHLGHWLWFKDVMARLGGERVFASIDIEGSEYSILEEIIAHAPKLTGVAIEFHDLDEPEHLDRLVDFVERFDGRLVHLHPNNCGRITSAGVPKVLELTFSRCGRVGDGLASLPHALDIANTEEFPDIRVEFTG